MSFCSSCFWPFFCLFSSYPSVSVSFDKLWSPQLIFSNPVSTLLSFSFQVFSCYNNYFCVYILTFSLQLCYFLLILLSFSICTDSCWPFPFKLLIRWVFVFLDYFWAFFHVSLNTWDLHFTLHGLVLFQCSMNIESLVLLSMINKHW